MVGYSKARGEPDTNWVSQPDVYMTYTDLGIYRIYIYIIVYIYTYTFKIIYIYIHMCLMNIQLWFKYDILYTVYIYIHCMEGLSFSLYIYIYICFGWIFKCIIYNIRINPTSICKYIYIYIYIWYPPWNLPFWHIHEMVGSKGGYLTYTLRVLYIYYNSVISMLLRLIERNFNDSTLGRTHSECILCILGRMHSECILC